MRSTQFKFSVDEQCRIFVGMLNHVGGGRLRRHLAELRSLIDPIIDANMAGEPTIEHEQRLAQAVSVLPWRSIPALHRATGEGGGPGDRYHAHYLAEEYAAFFRQANAGA